MVGHGPGGLVAATAERPLMVIKPGVTPGRFCVSQEENGLHQANPGKSFENRCLLNCHDTVMQSRYRSYEHFREAPQQGPHMQARTHTPNPHPPPELAPRVP